MNLVVVQVPRHHSPRHAGSTFSYCKHLPFFMQYVAHSAEKTLDTDLSIVLFFVLFYFLICTICIIFVAESVAN